MRTTTGTQNELKSSIWKLTRWRPKNDRRTSKNRWKSSRKSPRKRYGSASAWIFFTEIIFLSNFESERSAKKAEPLSSSLLPLFIEKNGRSLPPSSPRRAQLAQESKVASSRSNSLLEEGPGRPKWARLLFAPPFFTKCTPFYFFGNSFFRNITKLYEFCNDTYFPSARLRILTDCAKISLFDFRHITEFHGSRKPASFWFPRCLGTSFIVQQRTPSTSKRITKGCMSSSNNPRTKLGYDSCPSLLTFYRR